MVQPIIPQPLTNTVYGGIDFLKKFRRNLKDNKSPVAEQGGTKMDTGTFLANASQLRTMNGTSDSNGSPSVGDQELAQKENENNKTSKQQFNAVNFLKTFAGNVFDRILPDNNVEYTFPDGDKI